MADSKNTLRPTRMTQTQFRKILEALYEDLQSDANCPTYRTIKELALSELCQISFNKNRRNKMLAAEKIGVSRQTMHRQITKYFDSQTLD